MVYVYVIGGERQLGGAYEGILCKKNFPWAGSSNEKANHQLQVRRR